MAIPLSTHTVARIAAVLVAGVAALALGPGDARSAATAVPTTIRMGDFFYAPRTLTLTVGQRVRFLNVGRLDHTIADVDASGALRAKTIRPTLLGRGESQVVRFTRPGTVRYVCTLHPTRMGGTIVVRR